MTVYRLVDQPVFPPPELAEPNGLLAVGGDLSPERLLLGYTMGIFPWFGEDDPFLWWSPDPRCVLFPKDLHVSRSLEKFLRRTDYVVTFDRAFGEVIAQCGRLRQEAGEGTWITPEMLQAYQRLFRLGYAHSIECWSGERLVGGLYGVAMGRFFFGESMFHLAPNASKVAFVTLVRTLAAQRFLLIDCQLPTPHLKSLGAREVSRRQFLALLQKGRLLPTTHPDKGQFPKLPLTIPVPKQGSQALKHACS